MDEMDAFLAKVKADWLHYEFEGSKRIKFALHWKDPDGARYWLSFMNAYHWDTPLRLVFNVASPILTSHKHYTHRTTPVEPPRGYEHVDMELKPGDEWGPDHLYVPVTNEPRSPRGSLPPGVKLPGSLSDEERPKELPGNASAKLPEPSQGTNLWLVVTAVVTIAIIMLWVIIYKRRLDCARRNNAGN